MSKHERVAKRIAAEVQNWPPHGPCVGELWEAIRDILVREYSSESENEWLPLPAGFHNNNPLADRIQEIGNQKKKEKEKKEKKFNEKKPHTFQEWSDNGFRVMKGQKSTGRNDVGVATFTRNQVIIHNDEIVARYPLDDEFFPDELDLF